MCEAHDGEGDKRRRWEVTALSVTPLRGATAFGPPCRICRLRAGFAFGPPTARLRKFRAAFLCHRQRRPGIPPEGEPRPLRGGGLTLDFPSCIHARGMV